MSKVLNYIKQSAVEEGRGNVEVSSWGVSLGYESLDKIKLLIDARTDWIQGFDYEDFSSYDRDPDCVLKLKKKLIIIHGIEGRLSKQLLDLVTLPAKWGFYFVLAGNILLDSPVKPRPLIEVKEDEKIYLDFAGRDLEIELDR